MEEIKQLDQEEAQQIIKLPNSWREKGLKEGLEKGMKKGIQKGIQKGIEKGIEKGIHEGKMAEKRQIALEMLKEGLSMETIRKVTKLELKEIEKLRKGL